MGAPSSINDSDISVPLPEGRNSAHASKVVDMHVKLSRLIAKVINSRSVIGIPRHELTLSSCVRGRRQTRLIVSSKHASHSS